MRLLIVDDDAGLRQSLTLLLEEAGYQVAAEADPEQALRRAGSEAFDLILCDVRMPKIDGLTFLRRYRGEGGSALLIMMSAYGSEDSALAAMREGAYDYLHKPFRPDEVTMTIRKAEEREKLRQEVEALRSTLGAGVVQDLVVCESQAMRDLLDVASRVARHNTTVLITGESGTGKEVLARAVHRMSPRAERSFTAINCAAIPDQLLESELFGHAKGSFTGATADRPGLFELAHEGTLLLDEIGDLPLELQAKLLRVLEEGEVRRVGGRESRKVDVRVVAATAKALDQAVERGEFRADLFYRLNVVHLHIPPLRERPEDIPALLAHFAGQAAQRLGHPVSVTPAALAALSHHGWPGNVRELRNAVERAAVLGGTGPLEPRDFAMTGEQRQRRRLVGGARSQEPGGGGGASGHPARAGGVGRQPAPGGESAGNQPAHPLLQDAAAAGPHGGVAQSLAPSARRCRPLGAGSIRKSFSHFTLLCGMGPAFDKGRLPPSGAVSSQSGFRRCADAPWRIHPDRNAGGAGGGEPGAAHRAAQVHHAMTAQNLRGSRTTVVNMLAKARAASTETNRLTWLKVSGNKAWILARPRTVAAAGSNADTLGVVEDLNKRYGTTVAMSRDSIGFDPRGIASELGGGAVTLTVTKSSHSEVVTIDALGRVVK